MEEQIVNLAREILKEKKSMKANDLVALLESKTGSKLNYVKTLHVLERQKDFTFYKDGRFWAVSLSEFAPQQTLQQVQMALPIEGEPTYSFDHCHKKILKLLDELNNRILGQAELNWLETAVLLSKQGAILVGEPGVGKSDSIALLAKMSGLKYFKYEFQRDSLVQELTGGVKIHKLKDENNGAEVIKFDYLMENLLSCDVFIGNEIQEAGAGVIQACRQVFEEREWQGKPLPLKAFFLTQNPSAFKNVRTADIDRVAVIYHVVSNVTLGKETVCEEIVSQTNSGKKFEPVKPVMTREEMLATMDWVTKVETAPVIKHISALAMAYSKVAKREVTERFLVQATKLVKANAFIRGRMVAGLEDLDILEHTAAKYGIEYGVAKNIIRAIIAPKEEKSKVLQMLPDKVHQYLVEKLKMWGEI
jgi:MoxR-like ATPase